MWMVDFLSATRTQRTKPSDWYSHLGFYFISQINQYFENHLLFNFDNGLKWIVPHHHPKPQPICYNTPPKYL